MKAILVYGMVFLGFVLPVLSVEGLKSGGDAEVSEAMPYRHTNSKGAVYYLRSTLTRSKDGKARTFYYFTKKSVSEKGTPVAAVPEGYVVSETKNGLPVLKKKKNAAKK